MENSDQLRILQNQPFVSEIDTAMLVSLMQAKQIVLLDAGDEKEYRKQHIPSAINLPTSRFGEYYNKLSYLLEKNQIIATYCSRANCNDSYILVQQLHQKGFRDVFVYRGSLEEWIRFQKKSKPN